MDEKVNITNNNQSHRPYKNTNQKTGLTQTLNTPEVGSGA
jgi:hypothetical protein